MWRIRTGTAEQFTERVLRAEGELAAAPTVEPLPPIDDWATLFAAMSASKQVVMLECEVAGPGMLHLGPVVAVADGAVGIRPLMRDGSWDLESHLFRLQDVTRVRFQDRYSSVYAKYAVAAT